MLLFVFFPNDIITIITLHETYVNIQQSRLTKYWGSLKIRFLAKLFFSFKSFLNFFYLFQFSSIYCTFKVSTCYHTTLQIMLRFADFFCGRQTNKWNQRQKNEKKTNTKCCLCRFLLFVLVVDTTLHSTHQTIFTIPSGFLFK